MYIFVYAQVHSFLNQPYSLLKYFQSPCIFKAELSHYRHNLARPERNEDIFVWWKKNKDRFPLIAEAAKILLSVPATSVSSERTFSIAGLLYANTLRNRQCFFKIYFNSIFRLHATTAEMLILIKANLKKLKLAPSTEPDEEELNEIIANIEESDEI